MRLADDTQRNYPKFKHYIQVDFPKLIHVHSIVNALKKYGMMSATEVHQYLAWSSGPQIVDTKNYMSVNTHFPFAIQVEEDYVKTFEADSPAKSPAQRPAVGKNSHGRPVYMVGVIILRTLVHDSAYRTLKTSADPTVTDAVDRANDFQNEVYGGLV
jgi:hypothetical protein